MPPATRMSCMLGCLLLWAVLPVARGKKLDQVLKRLEDLEAKVEAQDVGRLQDQLNELRSKMGALEEALLQKANANEVMSPAEIHERFRIFHLAAEKRGHQAEASIATAVTVCRSESEPKQDVHVDVMSRAEVHDRFRLFAQSMNRTSSCAKDELQEVALPERSWMGWLFSVGAMGGGVLLGLFSLCVALGESKALEDRLQSLEERFEDRKFVNLATSTAEPGPGGGLPLRGKLMSGVAGAAVGSTTGAVSGSLAGGAFGAVAGLVPAVFTFGLSIPLGAAMGSSLGLVAGSVVGGGTGAVGGVKVATWYKARKDQC